MFKCGQCVRHKLTGDIVLIIEPICYRCENTFVDGYWIRLSNYEILKVAEFELEKRKC